jgi:hypothetical protein
MRLIKRGCGTFLSIRTIAVFSFALETTLPSKTLEIVVVEIFVGDAIWEEEEEAEILDVDAAKVTFALADNCTVDDAKVNISD